MTLDELRERMKAWGHATVNRYAMTRADHTLAHVLDKVRDYAPGTKARAERKLVGRDGSSRRMFMAAKLDCGIRKVPMWAVDPVPARNDASLPHDNPESAVDMGIPDELLWIDRAITRIERQNPLRGRVLRTEYTVSVSQPIKARMVAESYGGKFTLGMYRVELAKGLEVLLWEKSAAA